MRGAPKRRRRCLLLRTGGGREGLLLLLKHLRDGARASDRELLHFLVRRGRQLVEQSGELAHVLRLEERLEAIVRDADVLLHQRLVRREELAIPKHVVCNARYVGGQRPARPTRVAVADAGVSVLRPALADVDHPSRPRHHRARARTLRGARPPGDLRRHRLAVRSRPRFADKPFEPWLIEVARDVAAGALDEKRVWRKRVRRELDAHGKESARGTPARPGRTAPQSDRRVRRERDRIPHDDTHSMARWQAQTIRKAGLPRLRTASGARSH